MTISSTKPRIAIGSDHAGLWIKETVRKHLESAATQSIWELLPNNPWTIRTTAKAVGQRVVSKQEDLGIAVCGTEIGISIAANNIPGVRAALEHDVNTARLAREDNDANVVALGCRIVTGEAAIEMLQVFLTTAYLGGRRQSRVDKITAVERE